MSDPDRPVTATDLLTVTTADLARFTIGGVWLGIPDAPESTPTRLIIAAPCGGGGMLVYGTATITRSLPVYGAKDPEESEWIRADPEGHVLVVWRRDDGGRDGVNLWSRDHLSTFAPGGVAWHLGPMLPVTAPGGCPACGGEGWWPGEYECDEQRCDECRGTKSLPAPWAAPNLPTTPGYHRWEGA